MDLFHQTDVKNDLNQLKADMKGSKENSAQTIYIRELETEMNQLKQELKMKTRLNCNVEMLTYELAKVKTEIGGNKGKRE